VPTNTGVAPAVKVAGRQASRQAVNEPGTMGGRGSKGEVARVGNILRAG